MVTLQQAKDGAGRYIDNELLPKLDGFKRIALASYSALALENIGGRIVQIKAHPAVSVLQVIDENNNIDIDRLYKAMRANFSGKQKVSLPLIGDMYLDETDLDKLYSYMRGDNSNATY